MPRRKSATARARTIAQSLQEYGRGLAGGLMFSLPLLYTMEVWWAGFTSHPWRLALYVATTFALLLGYNYFAGLRRDSCFSEVVLDSVEEMGLGILVARAELRRPDRDADGYRHRLDHDLSGEFVDGHVERNASQTKQRDG